MFTLPPLQDFSAWLQGRPWDQVVGERSNCTGCPLSQWLVDVLEAECVVVDEETVAIERVQDEWTFARTPEAYRAVIEMIDYAGETPRREVQVHEVKNVLTQLAREAREEVPDTQMPE
jgi:hypothetical protein